MAPSDDPSMAFAGKKNPAGEPVGFLATLQ
jgi:hypothetical protein